MSRFKIETIFTAQDKVTEVVKGLEKRLSKFTAGSAAGIMRLNNGITAMTSKLKQTALAAGAFGVIGGYAAKNLAESGMDFEKSIVRAAARFSPDFIRGTKEFEKLSDAVRVFGRDTEFTSVQVAKLAEVLASRGISVDMAISGMPSLIDFATVRGEDLVEVSEKLLGQMGSFDLPMDTPEAFGKSVQLMTDLANSTILRSAVRDMESLNEAVKQGVRPLLDVGQSAETAMAMIGALHTKNIENSRAATTMKNIAVRMASFATEDAKYIFEEEWGTKMFDDKGKARDILDVMEEIGMAVSKMTDQTRLSSLNEVYGMIPLSGASALVQDVKYMRELREKIKADLAREGFEGITKVLARIFRDVTTVDWDKLNSAFVDIKIAIFEHIRDPLRQAFRDIRDYLVENGGDISNYVGKKLKYVLENFKSIVSTIVKLGKTAAVVWVLVTALKAVATVITIINGLALMNPWSWIILGVMLLITAIMALLLWFDEVDQWFMDLPWYAKMAVAGLSPLLTMIYLIIKAIRLVRENWDGLKVAFNESRANGLLSWFAGALPPQLESMLRGEGSPAASKAPAPEVIDRSGNQYNESHATIRIDSRDLNARVEESSMGEYLQIFDTGAAGL